MVPFSFTKALLKSRVMKERSWPSSPLASPNWVQRHAGLVRQSCRFAPVKKPPYLPMLPLKKPLLSFPQLRGYSFSFNALNPFPGTQPTHGALHFLSVSTGINPWFKKPVRFQAISGDLSQFKAP
jgi:hypothetical protein